MCCPPINLDLNSVEVATHAQRAVVATIATTTSPAPLLTHQTLKNFHNKRPTAKHLIIKRLSDCSFSIGVGDALFIAAFQEH